MARVIKLPSFCDRLIEETNYEYKTRHLIDGRIVICDQRISIVAGYMTNEVTGLSPFSFIHKDDVRWCMVALRQSKNFFALRKVWTLSIFTTASRGFQIEVFWRWSKVI